MEDLTTELGFSDFLAERHAEVQRAIRAVSRDNFHADEAVANGLMFVWGEYRSGRLRLNPTDIIGYWKSHARLELSKICDDHDRQIYGIIPKRNRKKTQLKPEQDECSEFYRQPRTRRQAVPEPSSEGVDHTVIQKENGQAAAKQLSALNLFASNNEDYLAVLTALTEAIRANERVSDDGTIKINWSELARQSNFILNQKRFDDRSVKTCFNKFSRHASAYLRDSVA